MASVMPHVCFLRIEQKKIKFETFPGITYVIKIETTCGICSFSFVLFFVVVVVLNENYGRTHHKKLAFVLNEFFFIFCWLAEDLGSSSGPEIYVSRWRKMGNYVKGKKRNGPERNVSC